MKPTARIAQLEARMAALEARVAMTEAQLKLTYVFPAGGYTVLKPLDSDCSCPPNITCDSTACPRRIKITCTTSTPPTP